MESTGKERRKDFRAKAHGGARWSLPASLEHTKWPATDGGQRRMAHSFLLADVASQARAVLQQSRIFDLRTLVVDQEGDCLVLRGSVDSFYHKQLAQELVKAAIEPVEVINEIQVDDQRLHRRGLADAW